MLHRVLGGAGAAFSSALLAAAAFLVLDPPVAFAGPSESASQGASESQNATAGQDANNNGNDLTRPDNSLDLRFRYRESSGSDSTTDREIAILRATSRIQLDPDWKLSLLAQIQGLDKKTSSGTSGSTDEAGLGDSVLQAVLIRTLSERWTFEFGARLVAPTAEDELGSGKWQIMPGFGVRYTFTEFDASTYFVPAMRYAMSFAGDPARRNISEPQIAPTFNIGLPDKWFLTLYPSYDIRINYGDPVSGQTGRLFLPADFAIGRAVSDHVVMSLEISVPIVKDYPVYDFKTEFRVVLKN